MSTKVTKLLDLSGAVNNSDYIRQYKQKEPNLESGFFSAEASCYSIMGRSVPTCPYSVKMFRLLDHC